MDEGRNKRLDRKALNEHKNITFEKKYSKIKSKSLGKFILYFFLTSGTVLFIVNITIGLKYDRLINRLEKYSENKSVILDYISIINKVSPSIVSISDDPNKLSQGKFFDGNCTGIIIDEQGHILTNYSAIKDFENIIVKLSSVTGNPIEAKIVVEDKDIDLAIIKIEFDGALTPIKLAKSDEIREGQEIAVLGNAIGDEGVASIIPGVVTSKSEVISSHDSKEYSLLQITAPINKDNTGGAICNSKGEMVGFASEKITKDKSNTELYYGLQLKELESIISSTNIFKSILGIEAGGIIVDSQEVQGYYIEELDKGGNAYKAGIRPTDIVIKVDDYDVVKVDDLRSILESKKKGDVLNCKILSDGEVKKVKITIEN